MPKTYIIFVRKYFLIFGGGGILLPVVSYANEFCVPPPLGLHFLCRLLLREGERGSGKGKGEGEGEGKGE